jgi:hypothetical protein
MRYPLCFALGLFASLFFLSCTSPTAGRPATDQQAESPLARSVTETHSLTETVLPTVTVVATDFIGGGSIVHIPPEGNGLIIAQSESQDRLQFAPTTEIWQRERIALDDLRVGDSVSIFGTDQGNGSASTDYIVILPELSAPYTKTGEYTGEWITSGKLAAIDATSEASIITIQLEGSTLGFQANEFTRVFRQQQVTLDLVEEESGIQYQGTLVRDTIGLLVEVKQVLIFDKPSLYAMTEYPLVCNDTNGVAHCRDEYLGIEFAHPASWGAGVAMLVQSRFVGYIYNYAFENTEIIAGGRSNPFMEPRGGMPTDFSGFGDQTAEQVCATSYAELCEVVQPGVVLTIQFPHAESSCNPGPGVIWEPQVSILVDLPDHKLINGLAFTSRFISEALTQELAPIQPNPSGSPPQNCDEANQQRFDERMQLLVQQLQDGAIDEETQANLQALRAMAQSFQGEPLPN